MLTNYWVELGLKEELARDIKTLLEKQLKAGILPNDFARQVTDYLKKKNLSQYRVHCQVDVVNSRVTVIVL
jgi:mRNA-degrading endonuclease RelE of RelBE toxin-antitoxin system